MARKNIFKTPTFDEPEGGSTEAKRAFPGTGPMNAMRSSLRELSANAIREIDPDKISDSALRDRLPFSDEDIEPLRESIRTHGQQIPILVRPISSDPERFEIVYGRRRLHALRSLGRAAKAIVRTMDDTEAVLVHGQENSARLDPSFIEKALFARSLEEHGYDNATIREALGIERTTISRMLSVTRTVPYEVIERIGPAHDVGRRLWLDLAGTISDSRVDPISVVDEALSRLPPSAGSTARFHAYSKAVAAAAKGARQARSTKLTGRRRVRSLSLEDGSVVGDLRRESNFVAFRVATEKQPEFCQWLEDHADRVLRNLHAEWRGESRDGD